MRLLTSTSDIVRIVTGSAVSTIGVHADWMDLLGLAVTPGRTNTLITTATTTTVVASPAASTQRNVRGMTISNNHASSSCNITVQHYDGTNSVDEFPIVALLAGEKLVLDEAGLWHHYTNTGAEYAYVAPAPGNLGIAGALAETMPRQLCPEVNTVAPTASGTLFMQAIYLTAGQTVSNISISSATTAAGTPTNWWFALFDGSRNLLANSADQTTTAWAANTLKTLAMTTPYKVPTSGVYYIGLLMAATTVITTKGGTARTGGTLASTAPILSGTSTTGLTTTPPNPAAAITGGLVSIYAAVS